MKQHLYIYALVAITIAICSCKNSPSTHVIGTYEGNYSRDTIIVGTATANVVEVNSLTVNIVVDLEHDADFNLNNVEVSGEDVNYILTYTGVQGTATGSVNDNHMNWILMSDTDTITFNGDIQN